MKEYQEVLKNLTDAICNNITLNDPKDRTNIYKTLCKNITVISRASSIDEMFAKNHPESLEGAKLYNECEVFFELAATIKKDKKLTIINETKELYELQTITTVLVVNTLII